MIIPILLTGARWFGGILRSIPWQAYAIAGGLFVAWYGYGKASDAIERGRAVAYEAGVTATDRKWIDAQQEANALQQARNARTTAAQANISNEVDHEHAKGRDAILRRSDDIRMQRAAATERRNRAAVSSGMPSLSEAACLAHAEGYGGLSWDIAHRALTTAELQQRQMNDLIDWVGRQGAVEP